MGDSAMVREKWQSWCGHPGCSAWYVWVENTKVSSSICSLSSKGEGKPPPQVSEGERGSRRAGQEQSLLLAQAPLAGAGARCRGAGWHRALPTSPELIASPEVVGAAPWGVRGACRAVPCCAAQLCAPTASSSPWAVVSTGTAWRWKYP